MLCPACQTEVPAGSTFCPKCGAKLGAVPPNAAPTPADKMRAAQATSAANAEPEQDLWHGGFSPKAMYGNWILAAVATTAVAIVSAIVPTPITWIAACAFVAVLWVVLLAKFLIARYIDDYSLTTQRLVNRHGILRQQTDRIEVIDIDDVTYVQGIVERMFGVGTIKVLSSDKSDPELFLRGIDDVQRVANLIDNARREERRKRGLYVEAV